MIKRGVLLLKFPAPLQCNEFETCELQLISTGEPVLSATYDFPL